MNTDRSVEELLELFEVQNISQLGADVIRELFDNISVKEVLKLCRVSKQFNIACNKESMWKKKVKNDYGIMKILDSTWKETARLLFESDMINLNAHWVNGKTYKELFEEGLESKSSNYFHDLYYGFDFDVASVVFPNHVHNIETAKEYVINDPETARLLTRIGNSDLDKKYFFAQFNHTYNGILDDENRLKLQITTMIREFSVVAHAVAEIEGTYLHHNFGLAQLDSQLDSQLSHELLIDEDEDLIIDLDPTQNIMNQRLFKLIDPMLYVISYCLVSMKSLSLIDIWG
uniref:F-box domain protein n=1 Tax=Pithovirus LCPAC401 TaxID=2506595 RepID=A0A481Z9B1_9VIRU|nr:MAG: F-box domain protein [Pithovirus LCPAC401]